MAIKNFNILNVGDLELLARHNAAPCVSIYTPLRNGIFKSKEGPVRFLNQLKLARKYLEKDFLMRKSDINRFLRPATALCEDHFFWKTPADGVAAFIGKGIFKGYRLPIRFAVSATVGNFFDLKPLFPLLMGNQHYYLLSLDKRHAKLFLGTRYAINEIGGKDMSKNTAIPQPDKGNRQIGSHGIGAGNKAAIFYGRGGIKDAQHKIIENFCRAVNKEIRRQLMFEAAPLLLSAPVNITSIYQKINGYPCLVAIGREITIKEIQERDLARAAWQAVRPYFEKKIIDYLDRYEMMRGGGKTSADPEVIAAAAAEGRVETLFCARNVRVWGRIDPLTGQAIASGRKSAADEDLAVRAALETFLQKGLVFVLSHNSLPPGAAMAAILRY